MLVSDYPRGVANRLWLWWFPAAHPLPVAPALALTFFFPRRRLPVSLLRLPPRPFPRSRRAARAAIALARLPGMKALRAPFQQTAACSGPAGHLPPPTRRLFNWFGRILGRAHGR